ncbi:MAG: hypothetical protein UY23_C0002G0060 [Candidatus Jorgensenbacteria bacterium GW2011_GWA1_48_11]|uniref:Uncharacterized protein n=1 Tax=Candidatus Jorgensenbacteria bacterium GW2011_GWA1_48_11 TaxID=1618660 RepID=A0A0G1UAW8_9BACT|nr:MAG: hypothetical protein UY23_C0002G0060 [Candidatus Jorgensenbacteria bacterium GW2011_GWA1_48_11]KKW12759.1 MAG: hypothetical protein UY51_C0001G0059 [Candidatus Jorgensenbacteria bacterium GW2011_GWB1_49_9]
MFQSLRFLGWTLITVFLALTGLIAGERISTRFAIVATMLCFVFAFITAVRSSELYRSFDEAQKENLKQIIAVPLWLGLGVIANLVVRDASLLIMGATIMAALIYGVVGGLTTGICVVAAIRGFKGAIAGTRETRSSETRFVPAA